MDERSLHWAGYGYGYGYAYINTGEPPSVPTSVPRRERWNGCSRYGRGAIHWPCYSEPEWERSGMFYCCSPRHGLQFDPPTG